MSFGSALPEIADMITSTTVAGQFMIPTAFSGSRFLSSDVDLHSLLLANFENDLSSSGTCRSSSPKSFPGFVTKDREGHVVGFAERQREKLGYNRAFMACGMSLVPEVYTIRLG